MAWTYEVDVALLPTNFSTTLTLSAFGGIDVPVTLDFVPHAEKTSVTKGGIEYECKKSKFHQEGGTGACVMYDLKREPPVETTKISATLLKDAIPALKIGTLSGTAKVTQPSVMVTPNMQVTAANENQCYNVFIDVTAEFVPGRIDFSFTFPISLPVLGKLTLSGVAMVGKSSKTRLQAEYRICCCAWNQDLPVAEREEAPKEETDPVEQPDLTCGEMVKNLSCVVTGDKTELSMKIKAREQDCPFSIHSSTTLGKLAKFKGSPGKDVTRP